MIKILKPTKDTYITNRIINSVQRVSANVGAASTLDLFKLYGMTYTTSGSSKIPDLDLSRALIKFDVTPLITLISQSKVDVNDSSFTCRLKLFDVYGGQPTPSNFTMVVCPLSKSFDEGTGKDIVFYSDYTQCNFLTSSWSSTSGPTLWQISGSGYGGAIGTSNIDYITSTSYGSTQSSQLFEDGDEDLNVDVTNSIKSILSGEIPDAGFRVSFSSTHENDTFSYFVKRFVSRHAYDESKHPQLIVRYDDSSISDQSSLQTDVTGTMFLRNFSRGAASDIISGSSTLTGTNCLKLVLATEISGGWQTYEFSGSKKSTGVYTSSVFFSSTDTVVKRKMSQTGSVNFTQVWSSRDGTIGFWTGSNVTLNSSSRGNDVMGRQQYNVSTYGIKSEFRPTEISRVIVHITDMSTQYTRLVKAPIDSVGLVLHDVHYSVRDVMSGKTVIPYDTTTNSTRLSGDSRQMFFDLDMSNLVSGRTYILEFLITQGGLDQYFSSVSPTFRIAEIE